jgi:hypothetical protein
LRATSPAATSTLGLEVLVHEVMAAITHVAVAEIVGFARGRCRDVEARVGRIALLVSSPSARR